MSIESGRVDHSTTTLPPMFINGWMAPADEPYMVAAGIKVVDQGTLTGVAIKSVPISISLDAG
jgi:hypothetical protein